MFLCHLCANFTLSTLEVQKGLSHSIGHYVTVCEAQIGIAQAESGI